MEFAFPVVWCCMSYASKGKRVGGELERTIGTPYCFGSEEIDSFVFNMVYLRYGTQGALSIVRLRCYS
jgi:hypothetical protein